MTTIREALNLLIQHDRLRTNDQNFVSSLLSQDSWTVRQQNAAHTVVMRYQSILRSYNLDAHTLEREPSREAMSEAPKPKQNVLDYRDGTFIFATDVALKDIIKSIPSRKWDKEARVWTCSGKNNDAIIRIREIIDELGDRIQVTNAACSALTAGMTAMQEFKASVDTVKDIKVADVADVTLPMKGTPYDHQIRGFLIGTTLKSFALLMEQGTGKTYTMISVLGKRFLDGEIDRCIVFCPVTVIGAWANEFAEFADFPVDVKLAFGTKKQRQKAFDPSTLVPGVLNVRVMSYDSLSSRKVVAKNEAGDVMTTTVVDNEGNETVVPVYTQTGGMLDTIIAWMATPLSNSAAGATEDVMKRCAIVCDESQRIKNRASGRTKSIVHLGRLVEYKAILSGTPVGNSPLDFFSQYLFLDQNILGDNYYQFRNRYCEMGGYKNKEIVGFRNLDELTERCHSIAFRVTKEEALDLPEFTDQYLYFDLEESKKYYDEMQSEMTTIIEAEKERLIVNNSIDTGGKKDTRINATAVISQMTRLAQLAGGHITRMVKVPCPKCGGTGKSANGSTCSRCYASGTIERKEYIKVGEEKLRVLQEFIEDFPKNKKLVVVCQFIPDVLLIKERIERLGRSCAVIYGATSDEEREELIRNFQTGTDPNVLVIQIRTAGLGITLTAADTMVFYTNGYSYMDYDQARARVHRIGQRNFVTYVHLVARNTFDEVAIEVLQRKKRMSDVIVDLVYGDKLTGEVTNFEDPDEVEEIMQEVIEDDAIAFLDES
jgi:SNF2 family DNA or RNA helicase